MTQKTPSPASRPSLLAKDCWIQKGISADIVAVAELRGSSSALKVIHLFLPLCQAWLGMEGTPSSVAALPLHSTPEPGRLAASGRPGRPPQG